MCSYKPGPPEKPRVSTVEETLNDQIASTRKRLEELCIAKAKLETLGLSQYPYSELTKLLYMH